MVQYLYEFKRGSTTTTDLFEMWPFAMPNGPRHGNAVAWSALNGVNGNDMAQKQKWDGPFVVKSRTPP